MTKDEFVIECSKLNLNVNEEIINKLENYKNLLKEWNNKFNLTTILNDNEIYLKHFYDSICITKAVDLNNKNICDFGTGAGFPGMVIAIFFSSSKITLIESNNKKVFFLNKLKKELQLNNVTIINSRVEEYGKNNRELYDIVTCRAVSRLKVILELSVSLIKVGGYFIPLKSNIDEEYDEAKDIISKFKFSLEKRLNYTLPIENSNRSLFMFLKYGKTPEIYPRNYNIIIKSK